MSEDNEAVLGMLEIQDREEREELRELAQRRYEELTELRARVAQLEAAAVKPASCDHPTYLVRKSLGLYWCSVCGAIAGSSSTPHFTDVVTGSFTDGRPPALAWVRPERAP